MSQMIDQGDHEVEKTLDVEIIETVDPLGGRHIPDFVDLAMEGLDERQLTQILKLRQGYQDGTITEQTVESRRLAFARWLLENGRLEK